MTIIYFILTKGSFFSLLLSNSLFWNHFISKNQIFHFFFPQSSFLSGFPPSTMVFAITEVSWYASTPTLWMVFFLLGEPFHLFHRNSYNIYNAHPLISVMIFCRIGNPVFSAWHASFYFKDHVWIFFQNFLIGITEGIFINDTYIHDW